MALNFAAKTCAETLPGRPPRIVLWAALLLAGLGGPLALSAPAGAQQSKGGEVGSESRRILHEYFDPWNIQLSGPASARRAPASGGARDNLFAGVSGQPPGLSLQPATDEMILGNQGPVDAGATATPWGPLDPGAGAPSRLDSATDRVDHLNYWANFEPSVVPYKRVVVQNQVRYVDGEYALHLEAGSFRAVAIEGGAARGDEEVFWGSFLLRARAGERHPIPSVAPDQRILSVQVAPMMGLRVDKDEADNFYIVPRLDGLLRVNMKVAVPRRYFDGDFSSKVTWADFSRLPQRRDTRLSAPVRSVAAGVLKLNGASKRMAPRAALFALIEYYRDFEARPFPAELSGTDLYRAISQAQVGVCRHRSLAFVISARALGVPARYIYNEAHAFAEVYWPKMGWRRIDLGGAAEQLDYSGRRGGGVHQAASDALPQPPNYMSELERMGADIPGYSQDEPAAPGEDEPASAEGPHQGAGAGGDESASPTGAEQAHDEADALAEAMSQTPAQDEALPTPAADDAPPAAHTQRTAAEDAEDAEDSEVDRAEPEVAKPEVDPRMAVRIDAVASNPEIFRGTALQLNGSIFSVQGRPIPRATIKVFLGPLGVESTEGLALIGEIESDASGRFSGQFPIPDDISIGRWSVILRFDGNDKFQPAQVD